MLAKQHAAALQDDQLLNTLMQIYCLPDLEDVLHASVGDSYIS